MNARNWYPRKIARYLLVDFQISPFIPTVLYSWFYVLVIWEKKTPAKFSNKYFRKIRNLRYFMLISQNKIQINCIALNSKGSFIMNLQFWIWKAAVKWIRHWVYICTIYYCALNIHSCFLILFIRLKMTQSENQLSMTLLWLLSYYLYYSVDFCFFLLIWFFVNGFCMFSVSVFVDLNRCIETFNTVSSLSFFYKRNLFN